MDYRYLGNSGLQVSAIGLGTNTVGPDLDEEGTAAVLNSLLDSGMNFIDTANVYSNGVSESYIGKALAASKRRQQALIATKCGIAVGEGPNMGGASRAHIFEEVHASLQRLQTDYIDLLQIHRPDPDTPIEETLRALDDLVREGKIRYVGSSNYAGWQLVEAAWASRNHHLVPYVSEQPAYNLFNRRVEEEIVPACLAYGIGLIPYLPLAGGALTGKYRRGQERPAGTRGAKRPGSFDRMLTDHTYDVIEKLESYAADHGHPLSELAIAWLLAKPAVSVVIAGASRVEQVEANAKAAEWHLTPAEVAEIEELAA